jgi:Dullard-like phosphatase family protein
MADEMVPTRPAVVLDLDETLVSTTMIRPEGESVCIRVRRRQFFVRFRPGARSFIQSIGRVFDVYFFTSSVREYGNPIIDAIAPEIPADHRFFRDSCVSYCGYPVKDLRLLRRPLNQIVLVDDLEGSALLQPENLIRVQPWQGTDVNDRVLLSQLLPALMEVAPARDLPRALCCSGERNQNGGLFLPSAIGFNRLFESEE